MLSGATYLRISADVARRAAPSAAPADEPTFEQQLDARAQLDADLSCHGRRGYDISGNAAFVWGLTFHVSDEVECCRACAAHRLMCGQPGARGRPYWTTPEGLGTPQQTAKCGGSDKACNAFVYCPDERCFSYTPHNHSRHECWLKHEANVTHPVAHGPDFPEEMRRAPRKHWPWAVSNVTWPDIPPPRVQWISGLVLPRSESAWVQPRPPSWFVKFCTGKYGPCTSKPPPSSRGGSLS